MKILGLFKEVGNARYLIAKEQVRLRESCFSQSPRHCALGTSLVNFRHTDLSQSSLPDLRRSVPGCGFKWDLESDHNPLASCRGAAAGICTSGGLGCLRVSDKVTGWVRIVLKGAAASA